MEIINEYLKILLIICVLGILLGKNRLLDINDKQECLDFVFYSVRILLNLISILMPNDEGIFVLLDYLDLFLSLK